MVVAESEGFYVVCGVMTGAAAGSCRQLGRRQWADGLFKIHLKFPFDLRWDLRMELS
jgi:hypothetical protein